jgi:3-oxoacyl-[acyl-carrier protein] reductase
MELNLKGKNVIITGGSRGIGRATAAIFAGEGANVSICGRNENDVRSAIDELKIFGVVAYGEKVDVADQSALNSWIRQSAEQLGSIDMVVANPSAFGIGTGDNDWQSGFHVDLMGTVHTVETALLYLERSAAQNGDSSILIMSSALIAEVDNESAYGAYKAALIHYTKGLARRLAPKGIRANAISPGTIYIENGFWEVAKRNMPEVYDLFFKRNPMGRMGCATEVAKAAVFLCSPAASFITGSNIVIDGGLTGRVNY